MLRCLIVLATATVVALAGPAIGGAQIPDLSRRPEAFIPPPLHPGGVRLETRRLAEGVYALVSDRTGVDNSGFVVGERGVLVIDAHINAEMARQIQAAVRAVTPDHGPNSGTTVVITGRGFTSASAVSFGPDAATFTVDSDNQITATLGATSTTGFVDVSVTNAGGTGTLTNGFDSFVPPRELGSPCAAATLTWSGAPTLGQKRGWMMAGSEAMLRTSAALSLPLTTASTAARHSSTMTLRKAWPSSAEATAGVPLYVTGIPP